MTKNTQNSSLPDHLIELSEFDVNIEARSCQKPWSYSEFMLAKVSRTFALNIQVLPQSPKRAILLAYLFCRMADTIEDDAELSTSVKQILLESFRKIFSDKSHWREHLEFFLTRLPDSWNDSPIWDNVLTAYPEWPLELFFDLPDSQQLPICHWVAEMCSGMSDYAVRRRPDGKLQLETLQDLDRYCYYVAGTVGYMLCEIFLVHSSLIGAERYKKMHALANSFGLGLQITNILKDIADDSERDTIFIPLELLQKNGIPEGHLADPIYRVGALKVVEELVNKATAHLNDALEYTLLIPRLEPRLRLFCLWPLFMALATLQKIKQNDDVFTLNKVKISRDEVKAIIKKTTWQCWSDGLIRKYFESLS
jgi:farnesyl-diphosphate farnesyltransferase